MTTVLINENTPEGHNLVKVIEAMRRLSTAVLCVYDETNAVMDSRPFEKIPGLPYTDEERIASIREAEEDLRAGGRTYTTEEIMQMIPLPEEDDEEFSADTAVVIDEESKEGHSLLTVIHTIQKSCDAITEIYEGELKSIPNFPYDPELVQSAILLERKNRVQYVAVGPLEKGENCNILDVVEYAHKEGLSNMSDVTDKLGI